MLLCKFCVKEFINENSLRNHERLCKKNPDKQITWLEINRDIIHNCNGAMKAKLEGRKFFVNEQTRKKISNSIKNRTDEWNKENGKKISETINKKVTNGEWHTSLAKRMHKKYKGIDLHGTWELKYAQYLDDRNITWIRNKDSFAYIFKGRERRYTPDFYLPEKDEYIEIKGYKTNKDIQKWTQFPKYRKLTIMMKKELQDLGINI